MPDGGALVYDGHAGPFHGLHEGFGRTAGGLHDADALFDADTHIGGIVGGSQGGHQGQIDGKGLIRQGPAFSDFLTQGLGIGEGGRGHDAQAAGVRDGRNQFSPGKPLHRAEQNGPLDPEHAGNAGFKFSLHGGKPHSRIFRTRRPCCSAARIRPLRKSGWAIEIRASARSSVVLARRSAMPYSVMTNWA